MKKTDKLSRSLTIRLSAPLEKRIVQRAEREHITPSEAVRCLLEREFMALDDVTTTPTLFELTADFVGTVNSSQVAAGRDANGLSDWNPDRRG